MIFNNKKGQNITKPYTIILIIVVIAMISGSLAKFGADMISSQYGNLDNESIYYIGTNAGFQMDDDISVNDSTDLFYSSDIDTSGNTKDYAIEFEFYREQSSSVRNIVHVVYNVPTFFVRGLNLDLDIWNDNLVLMNFISWLIILYVIYRLIRGSI